MVQDFESVFAFLADSGGYALLLGLMIILPFVLTMAFLQWYTKDRSKRMDAREAMERQLSQAREEQLRRNYEDQRTRDDNLFQEHRGLFGKYDSVLRMVTEAFGEATAVMREAKDEIRRTSESLDRNTALLSQFTPTLPKKSGARKPSATVERTVTHMTEIKASAEVQAHE